MKIGKKMAAKERWEALLKRKTIDRVPFFPMGNAGFCCINAGYKIADAYINAKNYFTAEMKCAEQYNYYSLIYASVGGSYGAWEFGGKLKFPKGEMGMAPQIEEHPVKSEEDVYNLKLPNVESAGSLPNSFELCKIEEKVDGLPISPTVHSVFTVAANLVGIETICRWLIRKPDLVKHLVEISAQHAIDVAKYWVDNFDSKRIIFYVSAPSEANDLISPKQFEKFVLPYQKHVHEEILKMGIRHIYVHICGEQNMNLPFWSQMPMGDPGILSFGHEVDIRDAGKYFPNDIIVGNVHPPTLHEGPADKVYGLCKECIEKGKELKSGFMLAPGCFISPKTPAYNYWLMQKALLEFGWY